MEAERRTKPAGDNCDEVARDHEARLQQISPPQLDSLSQEVGPAKLASADRVTIFCVQETNRLVVQLFPRAADDVKLSLILECLPRLSVKRILASMSDSEKEVQRVIECVV